MSVLGQQGSSYMTWELTYTSLVLSLIRWKCIVLEIPEESTHIHTAWGFRKHIIQLQIASMKPGSTLCICKSSPYIYKTWSCPFMGPSLSCLWRPGLVPSAKDTVLLTTRSLPSRSSWCNRQNLSDCSNGVSTCVCWNLKYFGEKKKGIS